MESSKSLKRAFIGLPLPATFQSNLTATLRKLKVSASEKGLNIKWTPLENMHITLKFLDERNDDELRTIYELMSKLTPLFEPLTLKLEGIGGFPDVEQARVLWAGVQNSKMLRYMQSEIEETMVNAGFPRRDEDFIPHVTIARLRNKMNIRSFISPFVRRKFGEVEFDKITVFESHLQGNFPVYKPLQEFVIGEK